MNTPFNLKPLLVGAVALSVMLSSCQSSKLKPMDSGLYVQPIPELKSDFIKGVDISTLIEVEANGGRFINDRGAEQDLFQILKVNGINWVRLRLWNNPYDVSWINDEWPDYGTNIGEVGGGTNDLEKTIELAVRAKEVGMKVLLDFHYSDFWADPGKQYIPDEWKDLVVQTGQTAELEWDGETELKDSDGATIMRPVYDCSAVESNLEAFTKDTLLTMDNAGVFPDMVQIGNEINNGLVHPCGEWIKFKPWTYDGGLALLQAGINGVEAAERETRKEAQIMLHLAEAGQKWDFQEMFTAFDSAGLAYDVIGASYYPMWHGSIGGLADNLNNISAVTGKPVVIAEVSYAFTTQGNDDPTPNSFSQSDVAIGKFLATEQGQATAVREVMNAVASVPKNLGAGIFYWEPAWIPVQGAGWISGEGNGWENQALFDYNGHELASMDVFWKVSSDQTVSKPTIVASEAIQIVINQGDTIELPPEAEFLYSDDAYRNASVTWSTDDLAFIDTAIAGEYIVEGETEDGIAISATISVLQNVIQNSSFEASDLTPWVISNSSAAFELYTTADANVNDGVQSLKFWCATDCKDRIEQSLAVANGTYLVTIISSGESSGTTGTRLLANDQFTSISLAGWAQWTQSTLEVNVTDGTLSVAVELDEAAESWGYFDLLRAIKQ